MWNLFGVTLEADQLLALGILTVLAVQDIRKRRLATLFLLILIMLAAGWQIYIGNIQKKEYILGAAVGVLFLGLSKVTHEAMGYGDSLLILSLGIYLGIWSLCYVLTAAFCSSAIVAIIKLSFHKLRRKESFPFVPCLTFGCFLYFFCG